MADLNGPDSATLPGMTMLKVSTPAELISAVPFLVGFHPADSLVVVAMHGPRISFALRMDLPDHGTPEKEARAGVLRLASLVMEQKAEAVTIIGYGEEARVTPAVLLISDTFQQASVIIVDELRVTDDRYWSYLCENPSCCGPEGKPCEPAYSVVATAATYAGAVALPSREALVDQLSPVTGDDREAMTAATARAILRLAALADERPPASDETPSELSHEDGDPFNTQLWTASEVSMRPRQPAPWSEGGAAESTRGDGPFHDQNAPLLMAATSAAAPGSAELHLSNLLWTSAGINPPPAGLPPSEKPQPDESLLEEPAAKDTEILPNDHDYFFARVRSEGRNAVQAAERCYNTGGRLTDDDAAWLGVLLLHTPVRDYAWARASTQEWELALWSDLMRRTEPRYRAAPASLLAFVAWRMGLGPVANIAVEQALDQKPNHPLAKLMDAALALGLPPSALDGWPVVKSMPPLAEGLDQEDEGDRKDEPSEDRRTSAKASTVEDDAVKGNEIGASSSSLERSEVSEPDGGDVGTQGGRDTTGIRPGRLGRLPVRVTSDVVAAETRTGAGEGPGRREKRPQKNRRTPQRRL